MPGGGAPAAQSIAIQMKQFHPGRSPKPDAFGRHVAGLAQSLALPHRDYYTGPQTVSGVLGGLAHAVVSSMRAALAALSRLVLCTPSAYAFPVPPLPPRTFPPILRNQNAYQ
jgi:hypothetical protein